MKKFGKQFFGAGSGIISPNPVDIHIQYSEMNGNVTFTPSKDLPYPVIVAIFAQLMIQFSKDHMEQMQTMVRDFEAAQKKNQAAIDEHQN